MLRRLLVLPFCACLLVLSPAAGALTNVEPSRNDHRWHDDKPGLLEAEHAEHRAIVDRLWSDALRAVWDTAVAELEAERQAAEARERAARAPRRQSSSSSSSGGERLAGSGACGGDLPPCSVMRRESGGSVNVWNGGCTAPIGWTGTSPCGSSSASGKWQFVRNTWDGFGGCVNAADCPESVQDEKARQTWAGGDGRSHWSQTLP